METLRDFVDRQVTARYGTAHHLATRIGMSLSAFSRGVTLGSLSVESLLRLARETGTPASDVLRIANKEHVAVLLEQLYGKSVAVPSSDARECSDLWAQLPVKAQEAFLVLLRVAVKQTGGGTAKRRTA